MSHAREARAESDEGMPGEDSFLDIVANIVGILIILVMVVGVRASQGVLLASPETDGKLQQVSLETGPSPDQGDINALTANPQDIAGEVLALRREIAFADRENAKQVERARQVIEDRLALEAERQRLLTLQSVQEQDLARRRELLDEQAREDFDVQRDLVTAQLELQKLSEQQMALVGQTEESEELICVPTPLAREVEDDSIHVRLRNGRLAIVPADELLDEIRNGAAYLRQGVRERGQAVDIAGPIDGFRMRLTLSQYSEIPVTATPLMASAKVKQVITGEFMPTSEQVGQPIEQALMPNSKFTQRLRRRRSTTESVVAWVYPDAYEDLRQLKRSLWEEGVPLAVFPLDNDDNIVFSSEGVKASAQ
ncbi:hypothetical protein [Adhaeretor mobilis]|uniref:Uncharacterized protein n=1 Tax=Adhaeretor mobilis TaxID=1930276 RepID=A0A517MYD4_9BACT|nr:hypothetical protein [Adhaeretor mobilis]QDS99863.1 hypothetical protein HG15A2_31940 [Adhaeretor mobilis]